MKTYEEVMVGFRDQEAIKLLEPYESLVDEIMRHPETAHIVNGAITLSPDDGYAAIRAAFVLGVIAGMEMEKPE